MKKWIAVVLALTLSAAPVALAQSGAPGKKKLTPQQKAQQAEQGKAFNTLIRQCTDQAKSRGLRKGSGERKRFMADCVKR